MKRVIRALLTTIFCGGYAAWAITFYLAIVSAIIPPLQQSSVFFTIVIVLCAAATIRIFWVQMKKPS